MTPSSRLGGFKILKDVARISLVWPVQNREIPVRLSRILSRSGINLDFLTLGRDEKTWTLNTVIQSGVAQETAGLVEKHFGGITRSVEEAAIISIFPHKSNPQVTASLLKVFESQGVMPDAVANSASALSAVLNRVLAKMTDALFEPFRFNAYRTPSDWKMAQKGKEQLYKEVVASYQERRPKVYALYWQEGQELIRLKICDDSLEAIEKAFKRLSALPIQLTFLITGPAGNGREATMHLCLPLSKRKAYESVLVALPRGVLLDRQVPVAHFSMNGPHFGDRYGIASDLLYALQAADTDLMGLSCSIASITGVLPEDQIQTALTAIQGCFEIPATIEISL